MLSLWGEFVTRHPRWVVIGVLLIFLASIIVSSQMKVEVSEESFEPRNPMYVRYHDILDKFNPEQSSMMVVVTSPTGNVVDREAFMDMLELEDHLMELQETGGNVSGVTSPAHSFVYAMYLMESEMALRENVSRMMNETPDLSPARASFEKLIDAENRYTALRVQIDGNLTGDLEDVFLLLPRVSTGSATLGDEFAAPGATQFDGYSLVLNGSTMMETKVRGTRIVREYLEILLNMSQGDGGSMELIIPGERHLRVAANHSLSWDVRMEALARGEDDVAYNVTYERIMSETSNRTFFEWYSLNATLYLALTFVYSGNYELAEFIYVGSKGMVESSATEHYQERDSWVNYTTVTSEFLDGLLSGDDSMLSTVMEETDERITNSTGYLHDFLVDYRGVLENYSAGALDRDVVALWTWRVNNVSASLVAIHDYSGRRDVYLLPYINETLDVMANGTHSMKVSAASTLYQEAHGIMEDVMSDLVIPHMALNIFLQKFDICLQNALAVGASEEPFFVRNATLSIALYPVTADISTASDGAGEGDGGIGAFYLAIRGLHRILNSGENDTVKNSTALMLWDYLTLNVETPSMEVEMSAPPEMSSEEMREKYLLNVSDEDFSSSVHSLLNYTSDEIYGDVAAALDELSNLSAQLEELVQLSAEVRDRYESHVKEFSGDDRDALENFVILQEEVTGELEDSQSLVEDGMDYVAMGRGLGQSIEALRDGFRLLLSEDLSDDGRASAALLLIMFEGDSEVEKTLYREIPSSGKYVKFAPVSFSILMEEIDETAKEDMSTLLPISLVVLIVLLRLAYGNFRDTFLSLSAVVIVIAMMYAFATMIGWSFDPVLMAVPIMMVGMGIDYGIHIIFRYREERLRAPRRKAMYIAVVTVGTALLFTSITSMTGFLSNVISSLEAIRRFGIMAAVGLIFSFVIMTTYIPAVKLLRSGKERRVKENLKSYLGTVGGVAASRAPVVPIFIASLLALAGILSAMQLDTQFDMKDFAPEGSEIVKRYDFISTNFNVSQEYSYIYVRGNIATPEAIEAMVQVSSNLMKSPYVVQEYGVKSIADMLVEYGSAERGELSYNETFVSMYRAADTDGDGLPEENIEELLNWLYENAPGASSVMRILSGDLYECIFVVRTDSDGLNFVKEMERSLWDAASPLLDVQGISAVEVTGSSMVSQATIDEINLNQVRSMVLSIAISALLLTALFYYRYRSPVLGPISALPVVFVVTWNWGVMYILGIPLNVMTNTIAAICVGLGIDYGIHVTHRFLEESERFYRVEDAIMRATNRIGRGLTGCSLTTVTSIGVLTLSVIPPLRDFALILALSIAFSYVSSLLVLPSMLRMWREWRIRKGKDPVYNEVEASLRLYELAVRSGDRRKKMEALEKLYRHHYSVEKCLEYAEELEAEGRYEEAMEVYRDISEIVDVGEKMKRCARMAKSVKGGFE